MKKFSFRLQKLLDLRIFKEKEAEIKLGQAIAIRDSIALRLQHLAEQEVHARTVFAEGAKVTGDFIAHENYIERLSKEQEEQLSALAEAELVIEKERAVYITAHQEKMVVMHLRDKKEQFWRKEQNKQQYSVIDDMLNTREYHR